MAQNNRAEADIRVLCLRYEYPAKLVCGRQDDADSLRLLPGLYATTINIHNPNDEQVFFFKKLALSYPPAEQKPGQVYSIGIDALNYDESLKADCDDLRRRLFEGKLPGGVIEGFLVVQGPRPLDVEGVYTAAPLARTAQGIGVSSIHLEPVRERDRHAGRRPLPDLTVDPDINSDLVCTGNRCRLNLVYRVRNIGEADAGAFSVRIVAGEGQTPIADQALPEGLKAGAVKEMSLEAQFEKGARGGPGFGVCIRADAPTGAVTESNEANNERCVGGP